MDGPTNTNATSTNTHTHMHTGAPASSVYTHRTVVCVGKSLRKCTYAANAHDIRLYNTFCGIHQVLLSPISIPRALFSPWPGQIRNAIGQNRSI